MIKTKTKQNKKLDKHSLKTEVLAVLAKSSYIILPGDLLGSVTNFYSLLFLVYDDFCPSIVTASDLML